MICGTLRFSNLKMFRFWIVAPDGSEEFLDKTAKQELHPFLSGQISGVQQVWRCLLAGPTEESLSVIIPQRHLA
jgi:hypothetical protein